MRRLLSLAWFACWPIAALAGQVLPQIPIETYSLGNGLRGILSPDHSSQVVTVNVWYNAGSRNEVRGRTGSAHLFEHMMFQAMPLPLALERLTAGRDSFVIRVQGVPLGWSVTTVEDTPEGKRLTERTDIGGFVEQQTTVDVSGRGAMLRVRQSGKIQGQPTTIELDYSEGRVKGRANTVTEEGPKSVVIDTTVTAATIDDNAIQGLLPSLPWSPAANWSFAVFAGGQNESRVVTLKVLGTETVALPAGPAEAYKVEFSGGWQPATFWVSTAAPHRLLKIGVANTPVEIVRAK